MSRRRRPTRSVAGPGTGVLVAGSGAIVAILGFSGMAQGATAPVGPAASGAPATAAQAVADYLGDPRGAGTIGLRSAYARDLLRVEHRAERYLRRERSRGGARRAVVLAVTDTALSGYPAHVESTGDDGIPYDALVRDQRFPAVPGMVRLARKAEAWGYRVFFVTLRGSSEETPTLGNLTRDGVGVDAGYPAPADPDGSGPEDGLYTVPPPSDYPAYLRHACHRDPGGVCTPQHFKGATRHHLEHLGWRIVANIGTDSHDVEGGASGRAFLLPVPDYHGR